ncbi:MAG: sulfatase [Deltaproteobacteria bacterium]|nr:sulfatase [Deltaproteobacteria bacterium]
MPSSIDIRYFIAALSIYALLSLPTALGLFGVVKILSWLKGKIKGSFLNLNRMDLYLLFGWGLLFFKWISNLMPYLLGGEHLPGIPYLLIVPLMGIHMWVSGFSRKTTRHYMMQWIVITVGAIFLSKTYYDISISSSLSMFTKLFIFVLFAIGALFIALIFHNFLYRIILNRVKPKLTYAILFVICLSGGCLFTLNAFNIPAYSISSLQQPIKSQNGESGITKNVIIVVVDCLRADHLGCYGYSKNTSPFLDRIARSGTIFEHCIAPSSWTIPSVVSLFTGVYPQQHDVNDFGTIIPGNLVSIQELMEKRGVSTAAFITNDFLKPRFGYAKGFSHYFDHYLEQEFREYLASRLFFLNALLHFENEIFYPYSVDPGGARWWSIGFPPFNHKKISAERITDDVLKWIDVHKDRSFYIYVHYMDVHSPYDTVWYPLFDSEIYSAQNLKEKLINTYDGRIAYVDQQIKRIWEELFKLNISDDTLLIITADHGEEFYDHEGTGHCTTLYDELIRVPLIMINTSFAGVRRKVEKQVQLIDLPMTALDFWDVDSPEQMKGESLLPMIGDSLHLSGPTYALSYTTRGRKNLKTEEGRELWEKKVWNQGGILTSLRVDNEWKIIIGDDGQSELFNLQEDEREKSNLKEINQGVFANLSEKLIEESSKLKKFTSKQKKLELSPDTRNRLQALGYL